jgi:tetratricopeptide (TPR) repeat protein
MSIILKALKKADASKADKQKAPLTRVSVAKDRRPLLTFMVALCTVALGFFFASYLFKGATLPGTKRPVVVVKAPPEAGGFTVPASFLNSEGIQHIKAGRHMEAEAILKDAVLKYPNDVFLHNHLGLAFKKQGKLREAVGEYEKAIELKPDYYIAMNNLAVALEALGDKTRAKELYEEALAKDPSISGAHLNYALLLETYGRTDEAESHYHTFLTLATDENLKGLVHRRLRSLR